MNRQFTGRGVTIHQRNALLNIQRKFLWQRLTGGDPIGQRRIFTDPLFLVQRWNPSVIDPIAMEPQVLIFELHRLFRSPKVYLEPSLPKLLGDHAFPPPVIVVRVHVVTPLERSPRFTRRQGPQLPFVDLLPKLLGPSLVLEELVELN